MEKGISEEDLRGLFTKPYGEDAQQKKNGLNFIMRMLFLWTQPRKLRD